MNLPEGDWDVYLDGENAKELPMRKENHQITAKAISGLVAVKEF